MIALAASHSHGRAIIIARQFFYRSILIGTVRANGLFAGARSAQRGRHRALP
jgi:hypothetical protein